MAILTEGFEVGLGSWTSTGSPTVVTTAYAAGTHGLKIDTSAGGTAFITRHPTNPALDVWRYYAFALYVPNWSTFWDGGNQWTPYILDFDPADNFPNGSIYIAPTSSSTGVLAVNYGGGGGGVHQSASVPMGAWVSVEVGYMLDSGFLGNHRFWVNGTDSGIFTTLGATGAPPATGVSFGDNGYLGDTGGADISYYIDEITVDSSPTGLIDLSGAFAPGGTPVTNGGVRVGVAFDDVTLEPDPTWTYLTDTENLVASYSIDRGRQFELDRTDTGTASVRINDPTGVLDPTNASGPYYGLIEPLLQITLDLWNPVTETWSTLYRGYIEDFTYQVQPWIHQNNADVTVGVLSLEIGCVDAFAILTAVEMQPNLVSGLPAFGDVVPAASAGNIFFDNANVDDRILQVLGNAGWPVALSTVFSGNVSVQESVYSPSENVLQVVQDAADAEFPGVGNVYVSRLGIVTFHGRNARFDPEGVAADAGDAWPFTHWLAGDEKALVASGYTGAQVRSLSFNRGLSKIINQALATPTGIADADMLGQVSTDTGSIATFGIRSWSAENLFTEGGLDDGLNALQETKLFADYMVAAFAHPRNRITECSFRSIDKNDPRATATWALLCGAEISDVIDVTVTTVGEGGFNVEPFFIEGVHYEVAPLNGEYADVTLTLDLSPQAYYLGSSLSFSAETPPEEAPSGALAVTLTGPPYEDETMTAGATGGV